MTGVARYPAVKAAATHLAEQIERNRRIAERVFDPGFDREPLARVQLWQRARLEQTYADLWRQDRYRDACEFFLDELYGGLGFRERDRQFERVAPVMKRSLPGPLIHAIAEALRLQAVSLEYDLRMSRLLEDTGPITQPDYARAYRELADWPGRREQIRLIGRLGHLLDETVASPVVHGLIRIMRIPARAGGFGELQRFLDQGLTAFAAMDGADEFIGTILERESTALEAIQAGSDWPFEPWIGHGPEI